MPRTVEEYLGRITSWHRGRPKFEATVAGLVAPMVSWTNFLEDFMRHFDIDTAVGKQLDILGEWIGRSRFIEFPIPDAWFSLDDDRRGFDIGVWKNESNKWVENDLSELDDEIYRRLLKTKILANNWDGSSVGATKIFQNFFEFVPLQIDIHEEPWKPVQLGTSTYLLDLDASVTESVIGSPVTSVDDISPNDRDAVAVIAGREPIYIPSISSLQNGILALDHTAVGAEWNAFIVARRLGSTADYRTLLQGGGSDHHILTQQGTTALGTFASNWRQAGTLTWAVNDLHLVRVQRLNTDTSIALDGGLLYPTGGVCSSNPNYLGAAITGGQDWGDVHQAIFLPGDALEADIKLVEGYLAHKWDEKLRVTTLSSALPLDHPYKSPYSLPGGIQLIDDTLVFVQDTQDMTMLIGVSGHVPQATDLAILSAGYIPLKPGGIPSDFRITSVEGYPLFGFDVQNEFVSGFDTGAIGVKPEWIVRHGPIIP